MSEKDRLLGESIGEFVGAMRFLGGLTREEFAEALGVHDIHTISRWENNRNRPQKKFLLKLADVFELTEKEKTEFLGINPMTPEAPERKDTVNLLGQLTMGSLQPRDDTAEERARLIDAIVLRARYGPPLNEGELNLIVGLLYEPATDSAD